MGDKLYIISRRDLSIGQQAVQGQHGLAEFIFEHPEIAKEWHLNSDYLAFLSVENEQELITLMNKALARNIKFSIFRESDLDNQITALVLAPGGKAKKLCFNLSLALKD
jgi:hypothetical protein